MTSFVNACFRHLGQTVRTPPSSSCAFIYAPITLQALGWARRQYGYGEAFQQSFLPSSVVHPATGQQAEGIRANSGYRTRTARSMAAIEASPPQRGFNAYDGVSYIIQMSYSRLRYDLRTRWAVKTLRAVRRTQVLGCHADRFLVRPQHPLDMT